MSDDSSRGALSWRQGRHRDLDDGAASFDVAEALVEREYKHGRGDFGGRWHQRGIDSRYVADFRPLPVAKTPWGWNDA